jgi:hypothetical protein
VDIIVDQKLDTSAFKSMYKTLTWTKLPRKLGPNHSEFFYSGVYSDDEKEIKVLLRPSLTMSVSESFKNRMAQNGAVPTEGYRGLLVDWGSSVEVKVPQIMFDEISGLANPLPIKNTQKIEW